MNPQTLLTTLNRLSTDPRVLDQTRAAGYRNAVRFPLSATANALRDLSSEIA